MNMNYCIANKLMNKYLKKIFVVIVLLAFKDGCLLGQRDFPGRLIIDDFFNNGFHVVSQIDSVFVPYRTEIGRMCIFDYHEKRGSLICNRVVNEERGDCKLEFSDLVTMDIEGRINSRSFLKNQNNHFFLQAILSNSGLLLVHKYEKNELDSGKGSEHTIELKCIVNGDVLREWHFTKGGSQYEFYPHCFSPSGERLVYTVLEGYIPNFGPDKVKYSAVYDINDKSDIIFDLQGYKVSFANDDNRLFYISKNKEGTELRLYDLSTKENTQLYESGDSQYVLDYVYNKYRNIIAIIVQELIDDKYLHTYLKFYDLNNKKLMDYTYSIDLTAFKLLWLD
ncbi:hypothetical protein DMA11_04160 [Marinilabiliaceae bacterium JC017]|nr:hypothetical protein DMA11_04160 [Marinilabiliaceae bacterium JC017]